MMITELYNSETPDIFYIAATVILLYGVIEILGLIDRDGKDKTKGNKKQR